MSAFKLASVTQELLKSFGFGKVHCWLNLELRHSSTLARPHSLCSQWLLIRLKDWMSSDRKAAKSVPVSGVQNSSDTHYGNVSAIRALANFNVPSSSKTKELYII